MKYLFSREMHRKVIPEEPYGFSSDEERNHQYPHTNNNRHQTNSLTRKPSRKTNNSTVSLLDFDRGYLSRESSVGAKARGRHNDSTKPRRVFQRCSQWLATAGILKLGVVGIMLGLLCAMLYQRVLLYQRSTGDYTLKSGSQCNKVCFTM